MVHLANSEPDWVTFARDLGDDVSTEEWVLLAELSGVLGAWPARSAVARRALDEAARQLQRMAVQQAD
ncbi:hypothetical protein [Alteraurantiacibacter palmitatis]|uniref:Uncharacterized protein n=1 Tax=Alteraurantiacibacter palmitatis TaxID=2054628 RepID=A0ABV7EA39_9SPHN